MSGASVDIEVIAYAGYRGDEYPSALVWRGERRAVQAVESSRVAAGRDPESDIVRRFIVRCADGSRFMLTHRDAHGWAGKPLDCG